MASWPSTLPSSPLLNGYSQNQEDSRLITEMDAGAKKIRNRYTANLEVVSEEYLLTASQYATFRDFYKTTLKNGAETFTKKNPLDETTLLYRFGKGGYELNSVEYPYYRVTLNLEILPQ